MGIYYCFGCGERKDNDYSPMSDNELCDECEVLLDGWTITYNPKPVPPSAGMDWDYIHEDYDGENGLAGTAKSRKQAIEYIIDLELDNG